MSVSSIIPFLLERQRAEEVVVGNRIVGFARYLLEKTPPRPSGLVDGTFVWIKDFFENINRQIYYIFHREAIDQAIARIEALAGSEEEGEKAEIARLAAPYADKFPDFAFYYRRYQQGIDWEAFTNSWQERGYILHPVFSIAPTQNRPLLREAAECLLLEAPFLDREARVGHVKHFIRQASLFLEREPREALNTAFLLGDLLPLVLSEGVDENDEIVRNLRELRGNIDFKELLEVKGILPLIAPSPEIVKNIFQRRALCIQGGISREILLALCRRDLTLIPTTIKEYLNRGGNDPQTLFQHVIYSGQTEEEQIRLMKWLLEPQFAFCLGVAPDLQEVRLENQAGLDRLFYQRTADKIAIAISGRFEPSTDKRDARFTPVIVIDARAIERDLGINPEASLLHAYFFERVLASLPEDTSLIRDAILNYHADQANSFFRQAEDGELPNRIRTIDQLLSWSFIPYDRRSHLLMEKKQLQEELLPR